MSALAAGGVELAGIRAVLVDMGGVLLDVRNPAGMPQGRLDWRGREALRAEIEHHGGRCSLDDLDELLFTPWRRDYAKRYERLSEARFEPHLRRLRQRTGSRAHALRLLGTWFGPYAETIRAIPGSAAALTALAQRGLALALVSNVPLPGKLYARVLSAHGMLRPFQRLFWSYDSGHRKPSPVMLREALAALGVKPEEAIMVGDRQATDVAAGRAAGVYTVWIESEHDQGPRPDLRISRLADLPNLLPQEVARQKGA